MVRENEIRSAEVAVKVPVANDAGLVFIGRIRTPWTSRLVTPGKVAWTGRCAA
jgi:tRNA (adenine37-N6)-methyltransferase